MKVPTKMKAAAIDRFGPPSVLKLHVVAVPEVGPNEDPTAGQHAGAKADVLEKIAHFERASKRGACQPDRK